MDFCKSTQTSSKTPTISSTQFEEEKNHRRMHRRNGCERCCRKGQRHKQSGILQHHIRPSEEKRKTSSDNRFIQTQQAYSHTNFSHGERPIDQNSTNSRTVGGVYRFKGRLLSSSHKTDLQEIPSVPFPKQDLAVQSPAIRFVSGPTSLYCSYVVRREALSRARNQNSLISRRLAIKGLDKRGITGTCKYCTLNVKDFRSSSKLRKKSTRTLSENSIPGVSVRPGTGYSSTYRRKRTKSSLEGDNYTGKGISISPTMAIPDRCNEQYSPPDTVRQVTNMPAGHTPPQVLSVESGKTSRHPQKCTIYSRDRHNTRMVDKASSLESIGDISSVCSTTTSVHRCELPGVGSPHGDRDCVGLLDPSREKVAHKRSGVQGSSVSPPNLSPYGERQECPDRDGQHHDSRLYQQGGGNEIPSNVCDNKRPIIMVPRKQGQDKGDSHQGIPECYGGPSVKRSKHHKHRMESTSKGCSNNLEHVVCAQCGLICYVLQSQTVNLCESIPRQKCPRHRRHVDGLEKSDSVCIPAIRSPQKSDRQAGAVAGMQHDPHSTILAQPKLVSGTQTVKSSTSVQTTTNRAPTEATRAESVPQGHSNPEPARVAAIRNSLKEAGVSKGVSEVISAAIRPSTQALYNKRWSAFENWCTRENIIPLEATVNNILEYLNFLKESLKLAPGTILGHRTAINTTLEQSVNTSYRDNILLKQFAKGILRTAPPKSTLPPWNLSLVLNALRKAPFEPLGSCDLKFLTFKTVFLITFASAARRSEVHAFSKDFTRSQNWSYVRLKTVDGFVAKNQVAQGFREFTIQSLNDFVDPGDLDAEILLCPVRALKIYNFRTLRPVDNKRLFVSFKKGHNTPIHPNTVSSWLKNCIILCYQLSGKSIPTKVSGHTVRAMSVSWASLKNVGIHQILDSCYWRTANTFISYYLKDLTEIEGDMKKLGKVAVSATLA